MKIALVHDCLREYGGAERVVEALHEMWPDAPLYTSFVDRNGLGRHAARFRGWDIRTSWIGHIWLIKKFISPLRFLMPTIWKGFDFSSYDVVISSSGWFISRGITVKKPTIHICYIHHPPRNLYGYPTGSNLQKYRVVRWYASIINFFLRHYDVETAQNVDYFIANSKETARRVMKFYRRDSTVIYPPIEINPKSQITIRQPADKQIPKSQLKNDIYYLSVGRLSWSKRVDLAIEACNKLKLPLKIVGTGKEEDSLRNIAGPTVEFVGSISDEALLHLYRGAKALLFCAVDEDFGMVPVEAMASGVPVIALAQGGVKETVLEGKTGIFFDTPTVGAVIKAVQTFQRVSKGKDWSGDCLKQARRFSTERFKKELKAFVESKYTEKN